MFRLPKMQRWMRFFWSLFSFFLTILLITSLFSQDDTKNLDMQVGSALEPFGEWLSSIAFFKISVGEVQIEAVVLWMLVCMIFFTVRLGFINLRGLKHAFHIISGHYHDPKALGDVSQFQALTTALSGTIGLGSIAGVAIAIAIGGPGAAFWMLLIGLLAMSLKFAECAIAVKYRVYNSNGSVSGGPMYYLYEGLKARGLPRLGTFLAVSYAVLALPAITQIGQINQSFSQIKYVTGFDQALLYGFTVALLTGVVIIGGIRSISRLTSWLVPLMAAIYLSAGFIILFFNSGEIIKVLEMIVNHAMEPDAVEGGVLGVLVIGMRRAVFSTEAGLGSSTIAHAAAKTREPISEGYVGLAEPFLTTLVGLMTALIILTTGAWKHPGLGDIQITSVAFSTVFSWFPWILAISAFLFAFSTIISWSYYIEKVWIFLFGDTPHSVTFYRIIYCVMLVPGAALSVENVINIMDSFFFLLAIPNIIGLYILSNELRKDLNSYQKRIKQVK